MNIFGIKVSKKMTTAIAGIAGYVCLAIGGQVEIASAINQIAVIVVGYLAVQGGVDIASALGKKD